MIPISETIFWVSVHEVIAVLPMTPVDFRNYILERSNFFNSKVLVAVGRA